MNYSTENLIGVSDNCFVGYAVDKNTRSNAASGGVVNEITKYLLQENIVQGVLTSHLSIENGNLQPKAIIARTVNDLANCKNSIYLDYNIGIFGNYKAIIEELKTTSNNFAIVGLYCHLTQFSQLLSRNKIARNRVILIGLFCSHSPTKELATKVLERQGADLSKAVAYHTKTGDGERDGRLYGRSTVVYEDGSTLDFPFLEFTTFKNAWFYTPKKCLSCPDQFAEIADISCGDAWYKSIRKHKHKQTTIITRNKRATNLIMDMAKRSLLELRLVDTTTVLRSQRRVAAVEKVSLPARVLLAKHLFGIKLPEAKGRIRLRDIFHSLLLLSAVKISGYKMPMKIIMSLPTPIVFLFTLLIKVSEQSLIMRLPKGKGVTSIITGHEDLK